MELKELEKRIKNKFGSIRSFCRCSEEDPYTLQVLFACERNEPGASLERSKKFVKLGILVKETSPNIDPNKISVELRGKVCKSMADRGGVYEFSKHNPKFSQVTIFQIIDGRRKKLTPLVKELINFLEIE